MEEFSTQHRFADSNDGLAWRPTSGESKLHAAINLASKSFVLLTCSLAKEGSFLVLSRMETHNSGLFRNFRLIKGLLFCPR